MIIGALLGLAGSLLPELLKLYKDRADRRHEKEMFELQMKYQQQMAELRITEARELAQIELDKAVYEFAKPEVKTTGFKLADTLQTIGWFLNTSVRPVVTYLVITLWLLLKIAMWQGAGGTLQAIPAIWTEMDNEFVAAVVFFWFGGRTFKRVFGR